MATTKDTKKKTTTKQAKPAAKTTKATTKAAKSSQSTAKKAENQVTGSKQGGATKFKPGQSGNPSGRPKLTDDQKDALDMIKALAPRAAAVAGEMLNDPSTPAPVRIKIVEMILDRTYGKPTLAIDEDTKAPVIEVKWSKPEYGD